ncbi:3-ketosteroid-9-alpha-monooxygenase oxygenase subunit [Amycolatopsis sp. M39]|nr:3-ketosteroid-9-alpha-monooxygenase oxygenase subunit [Amycolatopsis sp. M39]
MVQDKMLFAWNDPEGSPPPADVVVPRIEGATRAGWTWYETHVDTNCREVVDNVVDMAHFFSVRFAFPTYFKNIFEGHVAACYGRPS